MVKSVSETEMQKWMRYLKEVNKRDSDVRLFLDGKIKVRKCPHCNEGELEEEAGWLYNIDSCNVCGWLTMT